jgi:hypothetical protein
MVSCAEQCCLDHSVGDEVHSGVRSIGSPSVRS